MTFLFQVGSALTHLFHELCFYVPESVWTRAAIVLAEGAARGPSAFRAVSPRDTVEGNGQTVQLDFTEKRLFVGAF